MAEAVGALARRAGVHSHRSLSSGLELELDWARGAGVRFRSLLGGLDRIGVRDRLSLHAAAHLAGADGGPDAYLCGDDAVGLLARVGWPEEEFGREDGEGLRLNVELTSGRDEPDRIGFLADFVSAAATASGRSIELQIVTAAGSAGGDAQTGDLSRALTSAGLPRPAAEPLVLTPESLQTQATVLRRAELTLALSQPVALTSLMLGVPAALIRGDDRDLQRGDALGEDFSLPDELLLAVEADPRDQASQVMGLIAEPGAAEALRKRLRGAVERVARRRSATEAELLDRLDARTTDQKPPGSGRPADEDYRRLLRLHRRTASRLAEAEQQVQGLESRLDDLTGSASWRSTAPLRRASRALDRLRGSR